MRSRGGQKYPIDNWNEQKNAGGTNSRFDCPCCTRFCTSAKSAMSLDSYNPERDVSPRFVETVLKWIESSKEVFFVLRYLRGGGAKDYGFVTNRDELHHLIDLCPTGTDMIFFRDPQLPIRGVVDEQFIANASRQIEDGTEYLCVCMRPQSQGDPRLRGDMGDMLASMVEDLQEVFGEPVSLGSCPPFIDADSDSMVSASKDGIDGPR